MSRGEYSPLKHLALSVWLNHDPRRCYMAMFTAYFDASGHPDGSPVLFVSGFVSRMDKWLKFEREWAELLERYHIIPPFHMKEFAPGVGQYAAWKDDKTKRENFIAEAIHTIKLRTYKSFSQGVRIKDLKEVCQLYDMPRINTFPYSLCGVSVIAHVYKWMGSALKKGLAGQTDHIEFVFEDGDKHKGIFLEEVNKKIGKNPIFKKKTECSPFQAADFVAWEHARFAKTQTSDDMWLPRGSFVALADQIPHDGSWGIHEKDSLMRECERQGWPQKSPIL